MPRPGSGAVERQGTWWKLLLAAAGVIAVGVGCVCVTVRYVHQVVVDRSPVQVGPFVFSPNHTYGNQMMVTCPYPGGSSGSGQVVLPQDVRNPYHIEGVAFVENDRAICEVEDEATGTTSYYVLDLVRGTVRVYDDYDHLVKESGPCPEFEPLSDFLRRMREVGLPPTT